MSGTRRSQDIGSLFLETARRRGSQSAVVSPDRTTSFVDLADDVEGLARGFVRAGLGGGARVAVLLPPSRDFFAAAFGLMRAGAVTVLIDPGIGFRALGRCLEEAEPLGFLGSPKAHLARALGRWAGSARIRVVCGRPALGLGTLDDVRALGCGASPPDLDSRDRAAILFTSGSTGAPKGAVYEHGMFAAQVERLRSLFDVREGEVSVATFPLFALFDLALGQTVILPEMDFSRPGAADPMEIVRLIQKHRARQLFGSPALLDRVGRFGARHGIALPTLSRVMSAGAPVSAKTLERFSRLLPPGTPIHTPYGATEALPVALTDSREILGGTAALTAEGAGVCVGRPVPGVEVSVIRAHDGPIRLWSQAERLPAGEVGEIAVKGAAVTREYFRRPDDESAAKIADGNDVWHRMGDLGYFDAQGRLWFCGRKSQRVKTPSGELHTIPVEGVFNAHPAVKRTALVGVRGIPVLCVEKESGTPLSDAALTAELLKIGARYKHTRPVTTFIYHPSFPVDTRHNAKISREALAAWAAVRLPA